MTAYRSALIAAADDLDLAEDQGDFDALLFRNADCLSAEFGLSSLQTANDIRAEYFGRNGR